MKTIDRPIIILGAARSGTKMVRGLISAHRDVSAVPWDVNFIWKHGNYEVTHDELKPEDLTLASRAFIRRGLGRYLQPGTSRLVEKTVGNTLRSGFVNAVFPDAQFIHLIRDGRDVAESARRMWRAPMDWKSVMSKLSAFPPAAVPTYGVQYARSYLERRIGLRAGAVSTWGPRWRGIDEDVDRLPLLEVCALQWVRSVECTTRQLEQVDPSRVLEVRYETLCQEPVEEAHRIVSFLRLERSESVDSHARETIVSNHRHKADRRLTLDERRSLERDAGALLEKLGYVSGRA